MANTDRRKSQRRTKKGSVSSERRATDRRSGKDRRVEPRVSLELWMEELAGDDVYFRRAGNISAGGVYFDRAIPHDLGTEVTLKFTLPGDKQMVIARGKVISSAKSKGLGMGVKFISVEGNGKQRIRDFIASA